MRLISRSHNDASFREHFASLPEGSPLKAVWGRFLDLAPQGFAEFWVALEGDRPVGRVGASLMPSHPGKGAIGFFEAGNETVSKALLLAAETWLKGKGVKEAVGPMNLNTWFPYRFRTDSHALSFAWEPANPAEYPKFFEKEGYEVCESYHTLGSSGLSAYAEKTKPAFESASKEGFHFRPFDGPNFLEREIPILFELSMAGFRDNFLFEPITVQQFRELYVPIVKKMDFSCAFWALSPEGKEVAFLFAFPEPDYLVLKSATVLDAFRGKGLSTALTHLAAREGVSRGLENFISALVRTGNRSESYAKKAATLWEHRYSLYRKPL
jgi:GNAT superfamily N-acetyltransferase